MGGQLEDAFVRNLRMWREKSGLTQEDLAVRTGVSRSYIVAVESSRKTPSVALLGKVSKVLGVPAWALLCEDGDLMEGDGGWADMMSWRFREELWPLVDSLLGKG